MKKFTNDEVQLLDILKEWRTTNVSGLPVGSLMAELSARPGADWNAAIKGLEENGTIRGNSQMVFLSDDGFAMMYPERISTSGGGKMATNQDEKKALRYKYLKALYEETDGNETAMVDMFEIGRRIGLDRPATTVTYEYLKNEGLAEAVALGGVIKITHQGVKEFEQSADHPDQPTEHFPPLNIINNIIKIGGNMTGSQIQQGSNGSQINVQQSTDLAAVRAWIDEVLSKMDTLGLGADSQQEIVSNIETIKALLETKKPNTSFIKTALGSIKTVLENVAGNVVAALILGMPK